MEVAESPIDNNSHIEIYAQGGRGLFYCLDQSKLKHTA